MTDASHESFGALRGNEHLIGQRLGRYQVSSRLGQGGMAEVFCASDDKLDREVAIKVVLPAYASDSQLLQRFLREARVVASLEHPNILPIYDFGDHDGLPYLVLPLIRGGTLADVLEERQLDPARIAAWIRELAQALDAAHAAGVLHRDVKPGNVLVGRDEHLFLTDFGIARLNDATRLTRTGTVVGTPVYMAPEVASGKSAEAASDLYSLAVMSYEMLAGRAPFEGENVLSILHQHATSPVPPITGYTDFLAAGVDRVFEQGMAKRPADRPDSCRAFAGLLASQLPATVVAAPPSDLVPTLEMALKPTVARAIGPSSASSPAATAYATVETSSSASRRSPRWVGVGLLAAVVALVGFLTLQGTDWRPAHSPSDSGVVSSSPTVPPPLAAVADTSVESPGTEPMTARPPSSEAPSSELPSSELPSPESPPPTLADTTAPSPVASPPRTEPQQPVTLPGETGSMPVDSLPGRGTDTDPRSNRMRFNAMRSFSKRWTGDDFSRALEASHRGPVRGPGVAQRAAVEAYARGGLAYLAGRDDQATEALDQALRDPLFVKFWGSRAIDVTGFRKGSKRIRSVGASPGLRRRTRQRGSASGPSIARASRRRPIARRPRTRPPSRRRACRGDP